MVLNIASGAQEQATGLAEVNTAINQMDQATQQNAAMVEQSTAAGHALAQEAVQLTQLVAQFRLDGKVARSQPVRTVASAPKRAQRGAPIASGTAAARQLELAGESDWQDF